MKITDAMVEAACAANYIPWSGWFEESKVVGRERMRAALTAALAVEQEAVAWGESYGKGLVDVRLRKTKFHTIPLFAAPVAAPVQVKALEWGPYDNPVFASPDVAVAIIGFKHKYQVQRDPWGSGFIAYLAPEFGSLWWESKGHETIEAAKAAAQADYEQRIRSALISGDTSK